MYYQNILLTGIFFTRVSWALDCRCTDASAFWDNDKTRRSCDQISSVVKTELFYDINKVYIVRYNVPDLVYITDV